MKNILLTATLLIFTGSIKLIAQTRVEKDFELLEIVKVAETYRHAANLSFDIDYRYADSAHPTTILEQINGNSKISDGRYWTFLDSMEFIQGYQYSVAVYHRDSSIVVGDRQGYGDFLKLPILDSLFRAANVDSMNIMEFMDPVTETDTVRELTVYFGPNSAYSTYKLRYDVKTYLIKMIEYFIRNVPVDDDITSGAALVSLWLSGYDTSPIDKSIFQEDRFMSKSNGEVYQKPGFQGYKIFNYLTNKPIR